MTSQMYPELAEALNGTGLVPFHQPQTLPVPDPQLPVTVCGFQAHHGPLLFGMWDCPQAQARGAVIFAGGDVLEWSALRNDFAQPMDSSAFNGDSARVDLVLAPTVAWSLVAAWMHSVYQNAILRLDRRAFEDLDLCPMYPNRTTRDHLDPNLIDFVRLGVIADRTWFNSYTGRSLLYAAR
jgi:hypothetical protein